MMNSDESAAFVSLVEAEYRDHLESLRRMANDAEACLAMAGESLEAMAKVATFDGLRRRGLFMPRFVHGSIVPHADVPPRSIGFDLGDVVKFTNDYGVEWEPRIVQGFTLEDEKRCVFIAQDAAWFPVAPESLTLLRRLGG